MLKLYGSQFSLYTGKARSYLLKKGIEFEEITSTIGVYKNFIIPRTGVRYIPVVQTDDDRVIQDTTVIIDTLEAHYPERSVYPSTPKQKLVSLLLEVYADEWLVIPAMHYRWNFPKQNEHFIYGEFGSIVMPKAPKFVQRFLGKKVGAKFKGFVPRLGISGHNIPALESSYEQLLRDLDAHFAEHDYLLGGRPSIADFGFIGPLYAHLYRDPAPGELMREIAPNVCRWVERMNNDELAADDFIGSDKIPHTLHPILRRMASEHIPVLVDTDKKLSEWRQLNPDKTEVDRFIGTHKFTVEGIEGERVILPYALWMYRRPVDFYQTLAASQYDTQALDDLFLELGFGDVLQHGLQNKLIRENNKVLFE